MIVALKQASIVIVAVLIGLTSISVGAYGQAPAWNLVSPSGLTYGLFRGGNTTVYDSNSNELIVFSGFSQDQAQGFTHINDVWIQTGANGLSGSSSWINLIPNNAAGSPPGRHNASAVYDSANSRRTRFSPCPMPTATGELRNGRN